MNKFKKVVLTGVIASGIFSGISFAHADQVGGGDWRHGVGSYYVWSYYFHNYRNHSSSVSGQYFASSGRTGQDMMHKLRLQRVCLVIKHTMISGDVVKRG